MIGVDLGAMMTGFFRAVGAGSSGIIRYRGGVMERAGRDRVERRLAADVAAIRP